MLKIILMLISKLEGTNMSSKSYCVNGFGVLESSFNRVSLEQKIRFIKKYLPDTYKTLIRDCGNDCSKQRVWIEHFYHLGNIGFGEIFAMAINANEKDFEVTFFQGNYQEDYAILFEYRSPRKMTDREKSMSIRKLTNIFQKYILSLDNWTVLPEIRERSVEFHD